MELLGSTPRAPRKRGELSWNRSMEVVAFVLCAIDIGSNMTQAQVFECTHYPRGGVRSLYARGGQVESFSKASETNFVRRFANGPPGIGPQAIFGQQPPDFKYRGTSLTRKRAPLGTYRRPMRRVLGES